MITLGTDNNNDLIVQNGNLVIVSGTDQISQAIREALGTFYGEWFLDNTIGVRWLQDVFVDNVNLDLVQLDIVNAILSVPGVASLETFDFAFDNGARSLAVTFSAKTTNGQTLTLNQNIGV